LQLFQFGTDHLTAFLILQLQRAQVPFWHISEGDLLKCDTVFYRRDGGDE
jgi:hypothetical protein